MRAAGVFLLAALAAPPAAIPQGSVCAIGGGTENYGSWSDAPYRWIVQRADSQRIIVLSANAEDRWIPDYFQWCGADTSFNLQVATIAVANDSATYRMIRQCRGVFIKGGDQWDYVSQWRGTLTQQAIRDVFLAGGVVAGTSAGAAVLGDVLFDARAGSPVSRTALRNPRSSTLTLTTDFLNLVPDCLFDSHFYERGRFGRLLAMMAKHQADTGRRIHGVGLESETALCISPDRTGEVMGAGSVLIWYPTDRTRIEALTGQPLVFTEVKLDALVAGYRYSFPAHATSFVLPTATVPGPGTTEPPVNSLALFGDAFPGPVPLTQFIDAAGGTAGRCAVMTAPASAAAGQRYVDSLRARGVTDLSLVLLDAASANDSAAAAAIGRATGIVFTSNLSEQFPSYVDSTTRVGSALRGKLTSGVAAAFASQDAKLAGATMVLRTELEELAAYRGKLVPAAGLRGLRNLVVMPLIFQSDVYDWNRVAGLPWAIARTDGKTAIFLDEGSSATIDRDGVVRSEGLTPAVVVDARNATYVGYSTFRHSGSVGPRQATALVGATTHVLARDYRFNALTGAIITGTAGADHPLPSGFRLAPAYPNPFNPATTIGFAVPHAAHTILTVYDALGRNVATLVDGMLEAGEHSRRFEGSGLASGVYLVLLRQGSLVSSQKLVLIR